MRASECVAPPVSFVDVRLRITDGAMTITLRSPHPIHEVGMTHPVSIDASVRITTAFDTSEHRVRWTARHLLQLPPRDGGFSRRLLRL